MTKTEIKYLLKYLLLMIIPTAVLFYLAELLLSSLFESSTVSTLPELISKSITLVLIVGIVRLFKKEKQEYYTEEHLVSGIYLTFNAVIFLFISFCILYFVDIIFNIINSQEILSIKNALHIAVDFILITIFTAINLTKNIKLLR